MDRLTESFARIRGLPEAHEHAAVATVEEAQGHWAAIGAAAVKNLFLKDEGGAFWLVVARAEAAIDLKALRFVIGSKRLRFASADDLARLLGVAPGAVSPLAIINDPAGAVTLALDAALLEAERLAIHPNRNTATWVLSGRRLRDWIEAVRPGGARFVRLD